MRSDLEDVGLGRQREGKRAGRRKEAPSSPPPPPPILGVTGFGRWGSFETGQSFVGQGCSERRNCPELCQKSKSRRVSPDKPSSPRHPVRWGLWLEGRGKESP